MTAVQLHRVVARDLTTKGPLDDGASLCTGSVPALTIVCHPDLERVGERALLHGLARGLSVELSRGLPDFVAPGKSLGLPLEDPYVSRSPVALRADVDGGVAVERCGSPMRIWIAGEELSERQRVSRAELQAGVDLLLGEGVVLLLHRVTDPGEVNDGLGLIGASDAMCGSRRAILRVADLEVPVLLRGESGTGKELVARAIHENGPRQHGPFVGVNLGAVTPSLAAAELFGAVKGAYTGAVTSQKGFFGAADGGTLFLDEVGECPPDVQTMLLRALEAMEVYPVGSQVPYRADVRLIAASDSDLEAKASVGDFKEPLLHRLAAYEVWLAPLRQRRDDIGRLLVHFADQALREIGERLPTGNEEGSAPPWIPARLVARLCRFHWPGNVRQLRNVVWQLIIDSRGKPRLESGPRLERLLAREYATGSAVDDEVAPTSPVRRPADVREEELVAAMEANRWDVAATARSLGISRASVYELIRKSEHLRTAEDLDPDELRRSIDQHGGDVEAMAAELEVSARGLRRRLKRLGLL